MLGSRAESFCHYRSPILGGFLLSARSTRNGYCEARLSEGSLGNRALMRDVQVVLAPKYACEVISGVHHYRNKRAGEINDRRQYHVYYGSAVSKECEADHQSYYAHNNSKKISRSGGVDEWS